MMKQITLDIVQLEENTFAYLQQALTDDTIEIEDFETLFACLTNLEDTEIFIENYDELSYFSAAVIRMINEVTEDYGNITLSFGKTPEEEEKKEERKKIVMDISQLNSGGHGYLKELFDFPEYYGENLDALYDCLCELNPTEVIVINSDDLNKFSLKVLDVFDEVADEYGNLKITYEYDEEE